MAKKMINQYRYICFHTGIETGKSEKTFKGEWLPKFSEVKEIRHDVPQGYRCSPTVTHRMVPEPLTSKLGFV